MLVVELKFAGSAAVQAYSKLDLSTSKKSHCQKERAWRLTEIALFAILQDNAQEFG